MRQKCEGNPPQVQGETPKANPPVSGGFHGGGEDLHRDVAKRSGVVLRGVEKGLDRTPPGWEETVWHWCVMVYGRSRLGTGLLRSRGCASSSRLELIASGVPPQRRRREWRQLQHQRWSQKPH